MKHLAIALAATCSNLPVAAFAQADDANAPMLIAPASAVPTKVLPANTEVIVSVNQTLTSKGNSLNQGDTFSLTVVQDVYLEDRVIIPRGSRAIGRVTWLTSKGAFGKSGKMEIEVEYAEVGGRRIPLEGHFRQEGEGNTVATVGGVVLAAVFAGFVTGKSSVIPQGRELLVHTKEDLPVRFAVQRPAPAPIPVFEARAEPRVAYAPPAAAPRRKKQSWGLEPVESK